MENLGQGTDNLVKTPEESEKNAEPITEESTVGDEEAKRSEKAEENEANDCPKALVDDNDPEDTKIFTGNASDSDESDAKKFGVMRKKKGKNVKVRIESDSDSDEDNEEDENEADDGKKANSSETNKKSKKISNLINSDSEEEDENEDKNEANDDKEVNSSEIKKKSKKISNLIDSESEEGDKNEANDDEKSNSPKSKKKSKKISNLIDSDSEEEDKNEADDAKKANSSESPRKSKKISNLIDSDSEEDDSERNNRMSDEISPENSTSSPPKKGKSRKSGKNLSKRAAKSEAMNKIYSETQRLIRESSVSLPYHRPKQRTLAEFLNRKKIAPALPKASTMAARVKISAKIVSQALEEKEKEAETFYVELSESEDETDQSNHSEIAKNSVPSPKLEESCIEETQKLQKMDIQQRQTMIHNGSLDFAVSRKLFLEETPMSVTDEPFLETPADEMTQEHEKKVQKEFKRDLKDVSFPRKLFDADFEEAGGSSGPKRDDFDEMETISADNQELGAILETPKAPKSPKSFRSPKSSKPPISPKFHQEIEKSNNEDEDSCIYETPMISNKELAKSHHRSILPDSQDDFDEEEGGDSGVIGLPPPEIVQKKKKHEINQKINSTFAEKSVNLNSKNPQKKSLLNIKDVKPKIRGNPGMMIDLTESAKPDKSAINNLMDRFLMKHTTITKIEEKNAEITVLNTELTADGFKISKDTLSYKSKSEAVDDNEMSKPGAKLKRLREELQKQMASKRHEEWKQKEKERMDDEEENEDEDEELEPEDKEEKGEGEESEGESEPEVDDIVIKEKKSKNHDFCDDEAEVSEEELLELSGDEENEEDEEENEGGDDGDDEEDEEQNDITEKSKKFTRIIRLNEDSNSADGEIGPEVSKDGFQRKNTDADIFSDEEEEGGGRGQSLNTVNDEINSQKSENLENMENLKSKLFEDDMSSINDDDLLELCSARFPGSQNETQKPDLGGLVSSSSSQGVTDSQLMNLCSGSFPTQLPPSETFRNDAEDEKSAKTPQNPSKSDAEDTETWNLRLVSSSDSENEPENPEKPPKKRKKIKKLVLSDDEDTEDLQKYSEDEESEIEMEIEEEKFIDYDSEENEVIVVPKKDIKKVAANFLEEEAELSESEWGSADEDEKDLDNYELEEADNEEIDENKMRDQIGRIHARQVLDEDNRDVRMLKELLFDDGDLHDDGAGRERKFRWKNIDKIGQNMESGERDNEDDDGVEEENYDPVKELEWRKLRLEKQKFLEEKKKNAEINGDNEMFSDLGDGEILKLGMRILKKSRENADASANAIANGSEVEADCLRKKRSIVPRSVSELVQCSSNSSNRFSSVIKRGSFLARGDQALAKLAVMIKQTDTLPIAPKNSGNFVFTHLSPSVEGLRRANEEESEKKEETSQDKSRKRKSTPMTPRTSKKPKIQVQKFSGI